MVPRSAQIWSGQSQKNRFMKLVMLRAHSPAGRLHKPLEAELRHDKINSDPERNTMKTDTERVLTVLLALALALLAITAFALARAQQRYTAANGIRLNEVANGSHNETLSVGAMYVSNPDRSPVGINR
jgi:hypothetical protein